MNLHLIFFLLDIVGWIAIAVFLCNIAFLTKSNKVNFNKTAKLNIIFLTFCAGLFSVFINGFSDTGVSLNSFVYAFFVSFGLVIFMRLRTKKEFLPKISKRNRKLAYI